MDQSGSSPGAFRRIPNEELGDYRDALWTDLDALWGVLDRRGDMEAARDVLGYWLGLLADTPPGPAPQEREAAERLRADAGRW